MTPIKWTEKARDDVAQVRARIARDSRARALEMVGRIKEPIESCRTFPLASTRVEEWDQDDLRETYVGAYRVIYQYVDNTIYVLRVIHSARNLPSAQRMRKRKQDH